MVQRLKQRIMAVFLAGMIVLFLSGYLPGAEAASASDVSVRYTSHVQSIGWQGWVQDGTPSGTSGKSKRLEGIRIQIQGNPNLGVRYTTHCQSYGWQRWSSNGEMSGTEGEAKRLEAIKIQLTGADASKYDIYYRVHAQSYGWLSWAKNGQAAGSAGHAKRLEAIQIVVVPKGEKPAENLAGISSGNAKTYIYRTGGENPEIPGETVTNIFYKTHVQSLGWQGWKSNGGMSGTSGKAKRLEGIYITLSNKQHSAGIDVMKAAIGGTAPAGKEIMIAPILVTHENVDEYLK